MKIGILTFHLGPNHGGYLQSWTLCEFLVEQGHEVEIINYKNPVLYEDEKFRPWVYRRPLKLYHAWIKNRVFNKAYQGLPLSDFTTNKETVDWAKYDAVIVGSDVVWDFCWARLGKDPIYFGHFGTEFVGKRIAYAPSVGTMTNDTEIPDWVHTGLPKFDHVSVRDQATADLVQTVIGVNPLQVVDPTWLNFSFEVRDPKRKKYLIIYAYHISSDLRKQIEKFAKVKGLRMIAVGYYHPWADENNLSLGPLEWPQLVGDAQAMIAGTFHGTLYAIKMQCQFVTPSHPQIHNRVTTALKISGLESRLLEAPEKLEEVFLRRINYQKVVDRLSPHIKKSRDYLQKSTTSLV